MEGDIELDDHRPYIIRLYRALRNGWNPICRFWPRLAELVCYSNGLLYPGGSYTELVSPAERPAVSGRR